MNSSISPPFTKRHMRAQGRSWVVAAAADRAENGDLPKWETIDEAHEDSGRGGAFFMASSAQASILDFRKTDLRRHRKG
jgi:hypothetical protein